MVVHAPESFGPKTRSGEAVLKPIARSETRVSTLTWVISAVLVLLILGTAFWLRDPAGEQPIWLLAIGALALAFPIARLGYAVLRDDELQPFVGKSLWIRVAIVSALYAATWAAITWLPVAASFDTLAMYQIAILLAIVISFGTAVAYFSFDLEVGSAFFHYAFYLGSTILLRMLMALPPFSVNIES